MFRGTGHPVQFSHLAIFGEVDHRYDQRSDNAFSGNFGNGSRFEHLWIEHLKCAFWTLHGTLNMTVSHCRIRNTMADGINFCDGTSQSTVEYSHFRNTGDDALATWSPTGEWSSPTACIGNAFMHNRIEVPWHANGIAIYGGADHRVIGNTISDTVYSGAGVMISSGHGASPFSGTITVSENVVIRNGAKSYINESIGGVWILPLESDIEARIVIENLRVIDPECCGVSIHGPHRVADVRLTNVMIQDASEAGVHVHPNAQGRLRVENLQIDPASIPAINNEAGEAFTVTEAGIR